MRGLVIGHSFVSGLSDHFSSQISHSLTPSRTASLLQVSNVVEHITLYGIRGACVLPSFSLPLTYLSTHSPHFVIIDLGTNDIAQGTDPLNVAMALLELAQTLCSLYSVKHVFICSVLFRADTRASSKINQNIFRLNGYLKNLCQIENNIWYWRHKGFWATDPLQWSRDGLHPNSTRGRKLYKTSLRSAIFKAAGKA